jgi:hypothetical protein
VARARARLLALSEKLRLVAEVLGAYARARRAMSGNDVRSALRDLRGQPPPTGPAALDPETYGQALRLGSVVSRVCRPLPVDSRCLMQSLVLTSLLSRRGIGSSLVIAVRGGEKFGAHAWVELGDTALLPSGSETYERLVEL